MPTSNKAVRQQSKRMVTKKLVGNGQRKSLSEIEAERVSESVRLRLSDEAWNHFDRTIPVTLGKAKPAFKEPVKKPTFEDSLPKKPSIEKVFQAFQDFQAQSRRAISKSPGLIAQGFADAREELKDQLEEMGLAQHIDWTQPE